MRQLAPTLLALTLAAPLPGPAAAQDGDRPLSAIDWLSRSVEGASAPAPRLAEPPVSGDASSPTIIVTPLDGGAEGESGRLAGVLPSDVTGLPADLWSRSDEDALLALIGAEEAETLPALRELTVTLMLARAEPPPDDGAGERLFLARVDKLLGMGAIEPARALLESGDLLRPEAFRRWFDVTLLTGTEGEACEILREHPRLAPTLMARVFCTARNGDWPAAALTLNTARALGDVSPADELLLARFLDPEMEGPEPEDAALLPPARPSPLDFRLREAIGEAVPTAGLPLAFSHADLRPTAAWRAQMEAAERLARRGAVSEEILLALYTARDPAASGGVWDRAAAIQALDAALSAGDARAVAVALPPAWAAMEEERLEVPFARLFGERLMALPLNGEAAALAFRAALLSPAYEEAALAREPASERERLWQAVARGEVRGVAGDDGPSAAVVAGFAEAEPPAALSNHIAAGRVGEAILRAVAAFRQGLDGDHMATADAIASLRALGLEDAARRAALEYLILGRPA